MLLLSIFLIEAVARVLSETTLLPPESVHLDRWQLSWTNTSEDSSYTVEFKRSDSKWEVVPACNHITATSCNVLFMKTIVEDGCVMFRVQAEKHGLTSIPVQACSIHGDACIPEPRLSTRPGSMTIHLTRNHSLALNYANHAKHRIYFGREGEPLKEYGDSTSSVTISELEEGQRYCVKVEYIVFSEPRGPASCVQCEVIPVSSIPKLTAMIIGGVFAIVLVLVVLFTAYILIFHSKKIKRYLQPPYEMPEVLEHFQEHHITLLPSSPIDEQCSVINSITLRTE